MSESRQPSADAAADHHYFAEITERLDVAPGTLRRWCQRFADFLSPEAAADPPRFSRGDLELLEMVRGLLAEGYTYEQIAHRLQVLQAARSGSDAGSAPLAAFNGASLPQAVSDVLHTIADSQQSLANSQAATRELMGVVVQDNFNLKDENRKLRDRMLEMERTLAEYQRREETRKERLESRLRALETTLGALQQQVAHLVHLNRDRKRGWFW